MSKAVIEKLGYKPGMTVLLREVPQGLLDELPTGVGVMQPDLLVFFVIAAAAVEIAASEAEEAYREGARLWFGYPKKTGTIRTDLSRDAGWKPLLDRDFLPVTQIAIDATWSALRFRKRREIAKLTRKSESGSVR